jgi:shikimate dehydrogenase
MTRYLVGLLGEGIRHSLTPPMHLAEAAHLGIDYEYRVLDLLESGATRVSRRST